MCVYIYIHMCMRLYSVLQAAETPGHRGLVVGAVFNYDYIYIYIYIYSYQFMYMCIHIYIYIQLAYVLCV